MFTDPTKKVAFGDGRALVQKFTLKKREYLGTTSMASEWSLLMANQALARRDTLIIDPFAGTGEYFRWRFLYFILIPILSCENVVH